MALDPEAAVYSTVEPEAFVGIEKLALSPVSFKVPEFKKAADTVKSLLPAVSTPPD